MRRRGGGVYRYRRKGESRWKTKEKRGDMDESGRSIEEGRAENKIPQ
jgi:hypothetical protein